MNFNIIKFIKKLRVLVTFWVAKYDPEHLEAIRFFEASLALRFFSLEKEKRMVEIGGGAGWQKLFFEKHSYKIRSFDVSSTNYADYQQTLVEMYDGNVLPLNDKSVNIIFSSNTLEHVVSLKTVLQDHQRILKDDGMCLHILPSSQWRLWTIITDLIKKFHSTKPHSELSNTVIDEIRAFSQRKWIERFSDAGFKVHSVFPGRLFYTGNSIFGKRLNVRLRNKLSYILGSSCNYYILKKL